jgi:hypothetical protein
LRGNRTGKHSEKGLLATKAAFSAIGTSIGLEKLPMPATLTRATTSNLQTQSTLQSHENENDIRPADYPAA